MQLCGSMDDPRCVNYGGRISEDGMRADCYKENSPFYRALGWLIVHSPFRRATEGLAGKVTEGIMHAEGIDDD